MSDRGFPRFLLDCVVRPRQAARTARGIDEAWVVVMWASVVSALAVGIGAWIRLRAETDPGLFSFTSPGNAGLEASINMAIEFIVLIIAFPLGLFIWKQVLGFKAQSVGVQAAMVASFGLLLVLSPATEALSAGLWAAGAATEWLPMSAYLALSLVLTAFYFSESLAISYKHALVKNVFAAMLILLVLGIPIAAVVAIPIIAGGEHSPADGAEQ